MDQYSKEAFYEKIIENYYGTILVLDREGKIIYVNNNVLLNTKHITREDLLGTAMEEMVKRGYWLNAPSLKALKTKQPASSYIEGNTRSPLLTTSIPVFDENGELELVISYSQGMNYVDDMVKRIDFERKRVSNLINFTNALNGKTQFVAESRSMKEIFSFLKAIAYSDSTILITGESGTGKEVIAKYVYMNSGRSNEIFLPINCAAFPPELIEAELFGYEKGAFTGAVKDGKIGLFELAEHGTLFLDEIGELSLSLQSKLLRVLENGEIKRIGGNEIKVVKTRIITATNKNLMELVREKKFREDLYYRLNVIPVTIPPIRDRREDIFPLCRVFLNDFNSKYGQNKSFDANAIGPLENYSWPGNVREIKNVIERLFITVSGDSISAEDVANILYTNCPKNSSFASAANITDDRLYSKPYREAMREFEENYIQKALKKFGGSVSKTAEQMQISRSDLYYKLDKMKREDRRKG